MKESLFSKFTPSLMDPKTIEAIFVQRERLVSRLIDLVASDAGSIGRHHTLMIGPRGIGKTFLMTLLYNRISANKDLADTVLVAWLKEEEWGVTSYAELLISIIRASDSGKNSWVTDEIDTLYSLEPYEVEKRAEDILERLVASRMILLLVENLDMVFDDMGEDGQKKLRAFIQEKGMMSIIATSQGLFDGVSKQKFPFYGTFQINHLQSLTIDEALLLLEKMAKESNDLKLAEYIKTSAARARVRAVMHLSGGNHRVMAIFSQFLTYESLGELVKPFMAMIDELTPYYQSKMKELPAQQRKIVDFLCGYRGAAQVKEIARKCFLSHQASSSQLKALREKGYVVSRPMGRDSYYELAEPLMRLCVEVKAHRSGPVRLLIDLLRIWYSTDDLEKRVEFLKENGKGVDFEYACHALDLCLKHPDQDLVIEAGKDYFSRYLKNGEIKKAREVLADLYAVREGASGKILSEFPEYIEYDSMMNQGNQCFDEEKYEDALKYFGKACKLISGDYYAWRRMGDALFFSGRYKEAVEAFCKACELNPDDYISWFGKGFVLGFSGRYDESVEALYEACSIKPDDFNSWYLIGSSLFNLGKNEEAVGAFEKACQIKPDDFNSCYWKGAALDRSGRLEEAIDAFEASLALDPHNYKAYYFKAEALFNLGRFVDAGEVFDKACELEPDAFKAWYGKGCASGFSGKWNDAIYALEKTLSLVPQKENTNLTPVKYFSHILFENYSHKEWQEKAHELTALFKKHGFLDLLSAGILESLEKAFDPITSDPLAKEWLAAWENAAGSEPEFDIPLRIFKSGLKFRENQDERIMMDHPVEERMILEQILKKAGIYKEAE